LSLRAEGEAISQQQIPHFTRNKVRNLEKAFNDHLFLSLRGAAEANWQRRRLALMEDRFSI